MRGHCNILEPEADAIESHTGSAPDEAGETGDGQNQIGPGHVGVATEGPRRAGTGGAMDGHAAPAPAHLGETRVADET
eukprot:9104841-Lingulodinium_polyedra.AAC.1